MVKHIFLLALFFLCSPSYAEVSWDNAIKAVSEKRSAYYDFAVTLDPMSRPGTALNGIGHDQHICAIVGRMLGFREEISLAETFKDPPLTKDADPFELMTHSMFLDSWVAAAKRAIAMTRNQQASLWNLECVGKHGIPVTALITDPSIKGEFSLLDETLVIYGDIDSGFYERFMQALVDFPQAKTVAMGSAGGSVRDAILTGYEIRNRGLSTTLHGPCFSACPLVFAGGVSRTIWMGPGPHLGFHQIYNSSGALPLDHTAYQAVKIYLSEMGVDPSGVIAWMASATPDEIFEPDLELLCKVGIATWVQRTCF